MHEELEKLGGKITPSIWNGMYSYGIMVFEVSVGEKCIGTYAFTITDVLEIDAKSSETDAQETMFPSERSAVDWIIAQYFLARSLT